MHLATALIAHWKINQEAGTEARTITTDSVAYSFTNDMGKKCPKNTGTKQWQR